MARKKKCKGPVPWLDLSYEPNPRGGGSPPEITGAASAGLVSSIPIAKLPKQRHVQVVGREEKRKACLDILKTQIQPAAVLAGTERHWLRQSRWTWKSYKE